MNKSTNSGRDINGRYLKGAKGIAGPGRPKGNSLEANQKLILERLTPERIEKLVRGLEVLAEAGDVKAAIYLLDRCAGRSLQSIESKTTVDYITPEEKRKQLTERLRELGLKHRSS